MLPAAARPMPGASRSLARPALRGEAVIPCPKCFKENQDHYKFCLGCGAELPRDVAPKKFAAGTPPQGVPAVGARVANILSEEATVQGLHQVPAVGRAK